MNSLVREQFVRSLMRLKNILCVLPAQHELNFGEIVMMRRLLEGENVATVQTNLHVSKPAISQMLNSLEKKGYVFREIDTNDRRKIMVTVTKEGEERLLSAKRDFDQILGRIAEEFGEENMNEFTRLISHLTHIIMEVKEEVLHE